MSRKQILVVGGAGYIGSTVVYRALELGWRVRVIDRLMYGGPSLFRAFAYEDSFELIVRDVRDVDLDLLVEGCHYVFNAAALVGEHICKKFPKDAVEINQDITIEIGKACARQGVSRYIFACPIKNTMSFRIAIRSIHNTEGLVAFVYLSSHGVAYSLRELVQRTSLLINGVHL
jgi:UDP-glucose 4-epimerase